jgi:hypothetical protein
MTADRQFRERETALHLRSALGADDRIDLIDLREKPDPCAFTYIDRDFLVKKISKTDM